MQHKTILTLLLCLLLFGIQAQSNKPNIVIYLADDLGYLDIASSGAEVVQTPVLQKLSNEGMTFNNAFVASPSCAPSRAALLTGLMPAANGAETNHSYPKQDIPYLIDQIKKSGYKVLAFGKVAHYGGAKYCGFDFHHDEQVNLYNNIKGYLDTTEIDQPICLFVGDRRPHVRWTEEMIYDPADVDLPANFVDTRATREHRAMYYTDITDLDREMGHVLHYFEQKYGENTLTLFTSDHGAQWPFGKWNLYDTGIRTPLIVKWPGQVPEMSRTDAMVSWIDILPTVLDVIGSKLPKNLDGKSFKDVLLSNQQDFREEIYTTHTGDGKFNIYPMRSVRTDRYKLILNTTPDAYHTNHSDLLRNPRAGEYWNSWYEVAKADPHAASIIDKYYIRPKMEFYDLLNDPEEQVNLIDGPAYQEIVADLQTKLTAWMKTQDDDGLPHREPYPISGPIPDRKLIGE